MDLEKIFWGAQIILVLVFAAGTFQLVRPWVKSGRLFAAGDRLRSRTLLKRAILDGWFNRRLLKMNKWRWAAHFLLLNGVLLLVTLSAVSVLFDKILPGVGVWDPETLRSFVGRDVPLKGTLNEIGSLMMTTGWLIFAVRRYLFRPEQLRTNMRDHIPAIGLGVILLTGWVLEAVRILAEGTDSPAAFVGAGLAGMLAGLDLAWEGLFNRLFLFHGLMATAVLAAAPFSKWAHTLAAGFTTAMSGEPSVRSAELPLYSARQQIELDACTRCGECITWCPTYTEKPGSEPITPLAKIEFARGAAQGREGLRIFGRRNAPEDTWNEHAAGTFDCTLCGRCAEVCPVHIQTRDLWLSMREELSHSNRVPAGLKEMAVKLVETKNLAGDAKNERLAWADNLETPPPAFHPSQAVDVLFFVGCVSGQYPQTFKIPQAVCRLLEAAGVRYSVLGGEEWCCGFPLLTAGFREGAEALARHNFEAVRNSGAGMLLTGCPSCYRTWKVDYPQLLGRAADFEVMHSTTWLESMINEGRFKFKKLDRTVTYHDPCDLGRGSGIYEAPRNVLRSIPGLRLEEMAHNRQLATCCGGGGDVEMADRELTEAVAWRRMDEALATKAELVVTACQQCVRTLAKAAKASGSGQGVMDITCLAAAQLDEG